MVNKLRIVLLLTVLAVIATPSFAQEEGGDDATPAATTGAGATAAAGLGINKLGAGLGAGIALLGVGLGIGRIGGQAVEGMSRQPEAAGSIQTAMIIAAALIEGAGFFALVICLLGLN